MKFVFLLLITGLITLASCATHPSGRSGKVPPGQAKKIHGTKSAKPFAPGQQKK